MPIDRAENVSLRVGSIDRPPRGITVAPINDRVGQRGRSVLAREDMTVRLLRRHPFVRLKLTFGTATFEESFVVDTGFRSAVVLAQPFVAERGIVAHVERTIAATIGIGIGGPTVELLGRADVVEIGSFALRDVVVAFSQATAGTLADRGYGGIIGSEFLRRFRRFITTFDYSQETLRLAPGNAFRELLEFDLSGLFLVVAGNEIHVHSVVAGSPGDRAVDLTRAFSARRCGYRRAHGTRCDRHGLRFRHWQGNRRRARPRGLRRRHHLARG